MAYIDNLTPPQIRKPQTFESLKYPYENEFDYKGKIKFTVVRTIPPDLTVLKTSKVRNPLPTGQELLMTMVCLPKRQERKFRHFPGTLEVCRD